MGVKRMETRMIAALLQTRLDVVRLKEEALKAQSFAGQSSEANQNYLDGQENELVFFLNILGNHNE